MRVSLAIACKFKNLGFNHRAAQGENEGIRRKAVEYHFWPFGECRATSKKGAPRLLASYMGIGAGSLFRS